MQSKKADAKNHCFEGPSSVTPLKMFNLVQINYGVLRVRISFLDYWHPQNLRSSALCGSALLYNIVLTAQNKAKDREWEDKSSEI